MTFGDTSVWFGNPEQSAASFLGWGDAESMDVGLLSSHGSFAEDYGGV